MMYSDLMELLEGAIFKNGKPIPVARNMFNVTPSIPFIVYYSDGADTLVADNTIYVMKEKFVIELYTERKEGAIEGQIQDLLNAHEIYWEKSPQTFIESEEMYMVAWYV